MKPILVPIDFSENSRKALRQAVELARFKGATITLFHSFNIITPTTLSLPPSDYVDSLESEHQQTNTERIKAFYAEFAEICYHNTQEPLRFEQLILRGMASEQIEALAESGKYSMIVMGTKGASGLAKMLWGSIAAYVAKYACIPVLVVPEKSENFAFQKIVYATNFSEKDKEAIDYLRDLTQEFDPEITCLHVSDGAEEEKDALRLETLELHYWFTPVSRMSFELLKEKSTERGLKNYFKEEKVDMLMLMPRSRNFLESILLGSLSQKLTLHAEIPILVYKSPE